ncbi:MAG: exodeoxyribonuclease VII large subunit [Candidatus Tectomicrobia bacterium]|nr:exodeoxyribonuclease VII large subunit [Candidatus Tectomicrobia bacterium]
MWEAAHRQVYTVSALNREIRERLESGYPDVWVEGEVGSLRRPASGHLYFTLKDEKAQLRAVLFRLVGRRLRFELEDGMKVLARGRITVYEPRGEYQLNVDYVEPLGLGPLELAFRQVFERLEKEGLFGEARKRSLPFLPRRVGVVTSLSGAALRDILRMLRQRFPGVQVLIAPVRVQGEGAAQEIAGAIGDLNRQGDVDVMIVGRGGGSAEDLWALNDEGLARAIAASGVPVISAVGHEIDFTIADFAADVRAPTPTAAAELAVPKAEDLLARVGELEARIAARAALRVRSRRRELEALRARRPFRRPLAGIHERGQRLDFSAERLAGGVRRGVAVKAGAALDLSRRLLTAAPRGTLARLRDRTGGLGRALVRSALYRVRLTRERLSSLALRLEAVSPLAVLGRGYGICRRLPDLRVLREASAVSVGDAVRVDLAQGRLVCGVREVHPEEGTLGRA